MTSSAALPAPAPADPERALRERHAGARILVAEDNPINQEVAVELLEHVGLVTCLAADGVAALDTLADGNIRLVLMDVNMPRMDGLEATRRMRRDPRWSTIPVLAMTANVFDADQRACHEAGMNAFIGKPIDGQLLYAMLLRWLDVSRAQPEAPAATVGSGDAPRIDPLAGWTDLDTTRGLHSLNGRVDRYLKLLGRMVDLHGQDAQALWQAWHHRDLPEVRRVAHKLRGTAAMLGATRVADEAQWLDSPEVSTAAPERIEGRLAALDEALRSLFDGLRIRAGIDGSTAPSTPPQA